MPALPAGASTHPPLMLSLSTRPPSTYLLTPPLVRLSIHHPCACCPSHPPVPPSICLFTHLLSLSFPSTHSLMHLPTHLHPFNHPPVRPSAPLHSSTHLLIFPFARPFNSLLHPSITYTSSAKTWFLSSGIPESSEDSQVERQAPPAAKEMDER